MQNNVVNNTHSVSSRYLVRTETPLPPELELKPQGSKGNKIANIPMVLVARWDDVNADRITRLFKSRRYLVQQQFINDESSINGTIENQRYCAIAHTAQSAELLETRLGLDEGASVDNNYTLIARDRIDGVHCLVRLTEYAPADLRQYLRSLSSLCAFT
jgi:hypothetical protein